MASCLKIIKTDWYMQGLLGITLSAGVPALHGLHAAVNQSAFFVAMLYIVAIGTGAVPRCMSSWMTSSAAYRVKPASRAQSYMQLCICAASHECQGIGSAVAMRFTQQVSTGCRTQHSVLHEHNGG